MNYIFKKISSGGVVGYQKGKHYPQPNQRRLPGKPVGKPAIHMLYSLLEASRKENSILRIYVCLRLRRISNYDPGYAIDKQGYRPSLIMMAAAGYRPHL